MDNRDSDNRGPTVLKLRKWPIFRSFTILFSQMGLPKWVIVWSNCFSRGKILQMINIRETHGIYVPQQTNYMVTDKPYCLTYSVEFTCVLMCVAAL